MRTRREKIEPPFGTIKARMGATHFLMRRLKNVKTKMALAVLAGSTGKLRVTHPERLSLSRTERLANQKQRNPLR